MDLARLKALRELSIRHTMAAVADALSLTPSAVSQQIALLEEEVGVPLTERRGRGVKLTHAGEVLVSHAERIMAVLDEANSELASISKEISGTLRVAAFATAAAALLPPALQELKKNYPRLQITIIEMEPSEGLAALGSWNADLAIVDDLSVRLARMEKTVQKVRLIDDELKVVMAPDHYLARKPSIVLSELKDEEWAMDSATSFYGEFVMNLCRQAGFTPQINAACRGSEIIAAMVASGCSVSIIPGLRLGQITQKLAARPLRPAVTRRISVAFRQGERSHPAIKLFVQQLLRTAEAMEH
jgi:DNA-binding transcriptional LysR family regulator